MVQYIVGGSATFQAADKRERSELAHIRSGRYYSEPIDEICPSLLGVTQLNGLRSRISRGRLDFNIRSIRLLRSNVIEPIKAPCKTMDRHGAWFVV